MTALNDYVRLEATGLWRAHPEDQRREVIVAMGDASLTITNSRNQILGHWSLAAITRANPGDTPAIFHPDGDRGETLELASDEAEMIAAIDKLRAAIDRRRPRQGRLRLWVMLGVSTAVIGAAVFLLPDALINHSLRVLPDVKRAAISQALLDHMTRVSGQPCAAPGTVRGLRALSQRITGQPDRVVILPDGTMQASHLPDGTVILNRGLVENFEEPEVPAGFVLAELERAVSHDPLRLLLERAGVPATLRLLTTGDLDDTVLRAHAEYLLTAAPSELPQDRLLAAFAQAQVPSRPYAYALDITGEATLTLIEADPMVGQPPQPVMTDGQWVRLQGICGN